MLFASVYQAPVILNIVNNQWAISTFQGTPAASSARSRRAARVTAWPASASTATTSSRCTPSRSGRRERARTGAGPTLIEHVTYRGAAHSTSDDPSRYRPKDDYENWPLGDPVERLKKHLIALGEWSRGAPRGAHARSSSSR